MHKLSQKLAIIITNSSYLDDMSEMVSYSLEAILTTSITAISAFLLTAYTDCVLEYLIFNACFIPIRIRHKSFHFKKFIQCFICSNLMILLCCLILKYIPYHNTVIPLLFIVLTSHFYLSIERNKFETFFIAIIFTLSLFFNKTISLAILLSVSMNTILMLGRLYNEKNIKHD